MKSVNIVTGYEEFAELSESWSHLLLRSSFPHPQLTWEWFDSAWRHNSSKQKQLAVFTISEGRQLYGIAPLMVSRQSVWLDSIFEIRVLTWLLHNADVGDFIVDKNTYKNAIDVLWRAIWDYDGWDVVRLERVTSMSPNFIEHRNICCRLMKNAFAKPRWSLLDGSPYITVNGTFDSMFGLLKKSKGISDIDRRHRRLEETGVSLRFETSQAWSNELNEEMVSLALKKRAVTDHDILLADDRFESWLTELRTVYNGKGYWRIFLVYDDTTDKALVAYAICFQFCGCIYYWTISYDQEYSEFSIGKILLKHVLREIWDTGVKTFDFMFGAEEYKLQWRPEISLVFRMDASRDPFNHLWNMTSRVGPAIRKMWDRRGLS